MQGDQEVTQLQMAQEIAPTVEITLGTNGRATGWGWTCSCGDREDPRPRKKDHVLAEARNHFDTKHGGLH